MPPRQAGQLDEISEAIGRLSGQVESLDRYTHEREHSIQNLAAKVDGVGALISREVARLKGEIQGQLDLMERRVATLEAAHLQQTGAKNLAVAVLGSPLIGWVFAAAVAIAAWWKGGKL